MTTLDMEIEMTRALHVFAQTYRRQKRNPEMAPIAAKREIQFKNELEKLEAERARTQQPELIGHEQAA